MKPVKRTENLTGSLVYPIRIGRKAIIIHNGKLHHTANVIKLHKSTFEQIFFETEDANYCIFLTEYPLANTAVPGPIYAAA